MTPVYISWKKSFRLTVRKSLDYERHEMDEWMNDRIGYSSFHFTEHLTIIQTEFVQKFLTNIIKFFHNLSGSNTPLPISVYLKSIPVCVCMYIQTRMTSRPVSFTSNTILEILVINLLVQPMSFGHLNDGCNGQPWKSHKQNTEEILLPVTLSLCKHYNARIVLTIQGYCFVYHWPTATAVVSTTTLLPLLLPFTFHLIIIFGGN